MKILDIEDRLSGCVATVGSFDGIHLGHRRIFETVKNIAQQKNLPEVIITFRQHPRFIVQPGYKFKLLTTVDEKIELIESLGIGMLQFLNFDKKMASLTAEEFVKHYLVERLNVKSLIVGFNHKFGKRRGAGYEELTLFGSKYGFDVLRVEPVLYKGDPISSSRIRHSLENCILEEANDMLGYNYFFTGKVVQGKKVGQKIGFPTANLNIDKRKLLPCPGVYAVYVHIDSTIHKGVLNYGRRPTIENDVNPIPEVHIISYAGNLYGKSIKVRFVKFLRKEKRFDSTEALRQQISRDIQEALKIL